MKAVDFFCGAGGVTSGFRMADITVLGGIDIDPTCKLTYENNNLGAKFINVDISLLKPKHLKKELNITRNDKDLIFVGCSPCQYYTNLKTDKTKSRETRLLLEEFAEFVDYFRPGYIFIENVPGIEKNTESPLSVFKEFLKNIGYNFCDGVLNAKYFGVPQNRRRYVLIASRVNKELELPLSESSKKITVREAIGDKNVFTEIIAGHHDTSNFIHSAAHLSDLNLRRIRSTSKNGGSRKDWAEDSELQLNCYKTHDGHGDVYGRMKWDEVSPAITTRFCSLSNGRYGHPEQDRAISLREGATLQSFPLDYTFFAKDQATIARMIGNAVPPQLAKNIGKYIKSLSKK